MSSMYLSCSRYTFLRNLLCFAYWKQIVHTQATLKTLWQKPNFCPKNTKCERSELRLHLSRQKFIKKAKCGFWKLEPFSQTVLPEDHFWFDKKWWKIPKLKRNFVARNKLSNVFGQLEFWDKKWNSDTLCNRNAARVELLENAARKAAFHPHKQELLSPFPPLFIPREFHTQ